MVAVIVSACGGGGGDSTTPPPLPPNPPQAPATAAEPALSFVAVKTFRFTWTDVGDATHYRLLENPDNSSGFVPVGNDIPQGTQEFDHIVPLYARTNALYILESCNATGCTASSTIAVSGTLEEAIGYFKASNTGGFDTFGFAVSLSNDGRALAVGDTNEIIASPVIEENQSKNLPPGAGAVHVFVRDDTGWRQEAYLEASNGEADDRFGHAVSFSGDGNTLAVGASREDGNATGIDGFDNNSSTDSGAVYVFGRLDSGSWGEQAYVKANNTGTQDRFGSAISLSDDGNTLVVGAPREGSNATGIDGDPFNELAEGAGSVYIFNRTATNWSQSAYVKASNTDVSDRFGAAVAISSDGSTLAVGANRESSDAIGIDGAQFNNFSNESGAVYVYAHDEGGTWSQQAYLKASNNSSGDNFGFAIGLSGDGSTLAVGAFSEDSDATGIDGNEVNSDATGSGAVYVFVRAANLWSQQAYVKASNTDPIDFFGHTVSLSSTGNLLAVGALGEASNAIGVGGEQSDNSVIEGGAAYTFVRDGGAWQQQSYLKPNGVGMENNFGVSLSLSGSGDALAVGAYGEDGDSSGAAFVY